MRKEEIVVQTRDEKPSKREDFILAKHTELTEKIREITGERTKEQIKEILVRKEGRKIRSEETQKERSDFAVSFASLKI